VVLRERKGLDDKRFKDIILLFILTNILKIVKTSICKIPPTFPFLKGGIAPLWQRGARGDFSMTMSIQF
jgi:hypothetical protein